MSESVNRAVIGGEQEAARTPIQTRPIGRKEASASIPADFRPWWIGGQANSIGDNGSQRISLEDFYTRALRHSQQIRVFSDLPLIRETGIQEAAGAFRHQQLFTRQVRPYQ